LINHLFVVTAFWDDLKGNAQALTVLISDRGIAFLGFGDGGWLLSFLILDLNENPRGAELDPSHAIRKLQDWFPEATVLPGDQLARSVEHAETFFAQQLSLGVDAPERRVVESLRRKASRYGPSLAVQIPIDSGEPITGSARRVDLTFNYVEPMTDGVRNRLVEFLKSFGVGRIERSSEDGQTTELIFDNDAAE
jgi:hypothetical protein